MAIKFEITITDQGGVSVSGPLDNPIQAYGVLELGRQALADHYKKLNDRLVQPVSIAPSFKLD